MIEPVLKDQVAAPRHRTDNPKVGHVASGEQQHRLTPGKTCQGLLQVVVSLMVTTDQVRGPAAGAHGLAGLAQCGSHGGMVGQTQIVIAAEIQAGLAIQFNPRPLGRRQ